MQRVGMQRVGPRRLAGGLPSGETDRMRPERS